MAFALVGGCFASAIIPNLVDTLTNYLASNFNIHQDTKDLLEELTRTLVTIKATLDVVESSMMNANQSLSEWLSKLKLTAYEAEDLIDTFQAKAIEATVKEGNKVSNFASSSCETIKLMLLPDEDLKQLTKITDKLKAYSKDIGNLINLVNLSNKDTIEKQMILDRRETISHLSDHMELIGRENELGYILDLVLDSSDNPARKLDGASSSNTEEIIRMGGENNSIEGIIVIPIVGLGGVGKTALAQVVYNNKEVKESFALCAWGCCSNNSDIQMLMQKIIQILGGKVKSNLFSLEYLTRKLIGIINGRKVLLVIDDVSKKIEDQWDVLYATLSCGAPRSIVIITTQNRKFADRVATLSPIVLDILDWNEFLKLFYHHTFGNTTMMKEQQGILEPIAISIAGKLHGLPLAAKIIGNLLRFRVDENEWKRISQSEWWNMPRAADNILPSIGLNYQYLSPRLKQCFAYCSIFPKNYLFHKDRLVQMWIAHNFIPISNDGVNRLEDIARQWFDELVDYSFFQPAWDNSKYVMHNMMRDLAVAVSTDECILLKEDTIKAPQNVRHLAIETNDPDAIRKITEFKHLRTILYFGHCKVDGMYDTINETLSKSKNVRVLDLSYMHMQNRKPPTSIQHLSHLRFLDISSTGIEVLSSSIEHYHLQTMYLQECEFKQLPSNINNLINLRHLYMSPITVALINGIGKLTNLQVLNRYNIGKTDGHRVLELKDMNEISGSLFISGCENITSKEEAMQAKLMNKKHLSHIEFNWTPPRRESNIDKEVLDGLEPHKGLTEMTISGYMATSFPNWVMLINNFSNLKVFYLYGCNNVDSLPIPLGQLPFLNVLKIDHAHSLRYLGDQFYGNTQIVFPSLNELTLYDMPCIEEWFDVQARQFGQNLSKIDILECRNLRNAPLLSLSPSLKELRIFHNNSFTYLSRCLNGLGFLSLLHLTDCTMKITVAFHSLTMLEQMIFIDCPELYTKGNIQSIVNLRKIEIMNCPNIFNRSITDCFQEQKNKRLKLQEEGLRWLRHFEIDHNLLYRNYDLILGNLPSLQFLHCKRFELNQFTAEQDAWFRGLTSLKDLTFSSCNFEYLPASLTALSSLRKLSLTSCRKLISFEQGIPPSLSELHILQCSPEFNHRCQPPDGDDWPKISHVSYINIDTKRVQK